MKDIAIIRLQKAPDMVGTDGYLHQNRYTALPQMGISPKIVTGVHKLAQFVTKLLLTTQGSDLYDPQYGSGLLYLLRQAQSPSDLADIQGLIATHISDVRSQVIASQVNLSLPSDERLQDLKLLSVNFDQANIKFDIEVSLVSEAGAARTLNIQNLLVG